MEGQANYFLGSGMQVSALLRETTLPYEFFFDPLKAHACPPCMGHLSHMGHPLHMRHPIPTLTHHTQLKYNPHHIS